VRELAVVEVHHVEAVMVGDHAVKAFEALHRAVNERQVVVSERLPAVPVTVYHGGHKTFEETPRGLIRACGVRDVLFEQTEGVHDGRLGIFEPETRKEAFFDVRKRRARTFFREAILGTRAPISPAAFLSSASHR
jgi:hypothetical protein